MGKASFCLYLPGLSATSHYHTSREKSPMSDQPLTASLLLSCPDQRGLVARIAHFIFERGGNILDLDEHMER